MKKIFAYFLAENGYDGQVKNAIKEGLVKGERYLLTDAYIGQSSSVIELAGFKEFFNSVMFEYVNEDNKEIDLMKTKYNPYNRYI